jgi:hypothetical protein
VRLDRALYARGSPIWTKSWDPNKQTNDLRRLTKEELATYNYIDAAIPVISSEVGGVLKTPQPQGTSIDLSATFFRIADWSGINLNGVNLENVSWQYLNLKNSELAGVTQFTDASFFNTAWWEARSINRRLLEYLKRTYAFSPGTVYGPRSEVVTQSDYDTAVRRLMSRLK